MPRKYLALVIAALSTGCINHVEPEELAESQPDSEAAGETVTRSGGNAALAPQRAVSGISGRTELGRGTLVSATAGPDAQSSLCVSVDAKSGEVRSIDGLTCTVAWQMHECTPDDCPWLDCGGCLFHLDRTSDSLQANHDRSGAPWVLSFHSGSCTACDGDYEVYADSQCSSSGRE